MNLNDILLLRVTKCTTVSTFWKELVIKGAAVPCANRFGQRKFGLNEDKIVWSLAVKAKKETRLCVLHLKILHKIYPTDILLFKMLVSWYFKPSQPQRITSGLCLS